MFNRETKEQEMITRNEKIELYEILEDCKNRTEFMMSIFLVWNPLDAPLNKNDMNGFYDLVDVLDTRLKDCIDKLELD